MTNSYLITLTPTGKFFFGGEMTFKVKNETDDYNSQYSSYIISSKKMPQQTSLLGMLRFLILRNAGNEVFANDRIVSTDRASSLIGYGSFKVNNREHEKNSFGKIESITPCFLIDEYGHVAVSCNVDPAKFDMKSDEQTIASINGMTIHVPKNQYNPKDADEDPLSDYFKTDQRIGLNKDYSGEKKQKNDDTDLFKQINYRLNEEKKLKFAFYANVDSDVPLSEYDGHLTSTMRHPFPVRVCARLDFQLLNPGLGCSGYRKAA